MSACMACYPFLFGERSAKTHEGHGELAPLAAGLKGYRDAG